MLADIKAGRIKRVIVKDMSRFGRDYLQVGMYTDVVFPEFGVQFIADNEDVVKQVSSDFSRKNFRISSYEMEKVVENGKMKYSVTLVIKAKQLDEEGLLILLLHDITGVTVKKII